MRVSRGVKRLLATIIISAPSLGNVGLLLLLLMYIYSILGVELFANVAHGEFINSDANFEGFGSALLTLARCITGESYNGIMHDAMVREISLNVEVKHGIMHAPVKETGSDPHSHSLPSPR